MNIRKIRIRKDWELTVLFSLFLIFPLSVKGADVPSPEEVVARKARLPTIEDLTGGKVKKGDLIDKDNMRLVQEYLSPGVAEAIKQGMVLIMGTNSEPDVGVTKPFLEVHEKTKGKAIMDENGTVYFEKLGTPWPGGIPFPEPKNGLEAMANTKFGFGADDFFAQGTILFIDPEGRSYKKITSEFLYMWCNTRTDLPPLGTISGNKDIMYKRIQVMTTPIELRGLGQYTVRYYDDAQKYDTGFAYFPAFKRNLRVSATTWQDNVGGSDLTYGDAMGLLEPYSNWTFKLIGTRYVLLPEHKSPFPYLDDKGEINERLQFDVGKKFPRMGWAIFPMHIVEAIPKIKHIYGKKTLYILSAPYWEPTGQIQIVDIYDAQMKLWKLYLNMNGDYNESMHYSIVYGVFMSDLMTGHMSHFWMKYDLNVGYEPGDINIMTLLKRGR